MKNQNGWQAFELLGELDDGMIAAATLPDTDGMAVSPRKRREAGGFGRLMESGWVAAAASVVVAVAVLAGIVAAGRMGNAVPPAGENPLNTHPGHLDGALPDADTENRFPSESEDPLAPSDTVHVTPETFPLPETEVNPDYSDPGEVGPVSVSFDDGRTLYPKGYCVWISGQQSDGKGGFTGFDGDGPGAASQLAQIADELPAFTTDGDACSLFLAPNMTLQSVRVYERAQNGSYEEMAMPGGFEETDDLLNSLCRRDGSYIIVLGIHYETYYSADEYVKGLDEYAFRWTVNTAVQKELILHDLVLDNGYMLWIETWYDGGMVCGEGRGAESQLAELVARGAFDAYRLRYPVWTPYRFTWGDTEAPLVRVAVYDTSLTPVGEAKNFTVLHDLPAGEYIVILTVTLPGAYIPEADAYERACCEYPLWLSLYDPSTVSDGTGPLEVTVGSGTVSPYAATVSGRVWTGDKWNTFEASLPPFSNLLKLMPVVFYTSDTEIRLSSDATLRSVEIYDRNLNRITYQTLDPETGLQQVTELQEALSPGTYHVAIGADVRGRYIESEKQSEKRHQSFFFTVIIPER